MQIISAPGAQWIPAIAAHPDDIESWCAGTLAPAIGAGALVNLVLVTSGEHGSADPAATPAAVGRRREQEAQQAAALLGIRSVSFLHYADGDVENTRELRRDLAAAIRRHRPAIVFTHDPQQPWPPYLSHRDHRSVGRAVLDAVYPPARDRPAFPEPAAQDLAPHTVSAV